MNLFIWINIIIFLLTLGIITGFLSIFFVCGYYYLLLKNSSSELAGIYQEKVNAKRNIREKE